PSVHRFMRVTPAFSAGFSQQLQARSRSKNSGWHVVRCAPSLDVLAEGAMRSPGMMLTPEFAECVAELRNHYDFVIIDGPPLTFDAECRVLDRLLDGLAIAAKRPDEPGLERAGALFSAKTWSKLVAVA
ncbi:MAG TPA: hypothetical protein VMF89_19080, partial [Polyangiales bacterium]|nr:hypothetical protein [Polyangiales bacterium]